MTKTLEYSEKETLISLHLTEAIKRFPYPDDDFFGQNKAELILKEDPRSAQLNGLWQMALNAENIDDMCKELIRKVSKATHPEWRIEVINTLERPVPHERVELWKFLVQSLIYIREDTGGFLSRWRKKHIKKINGILEDNNYDKLADADVTLSDQQRLELACSFIHRFVTRIIVERKMREG